MVRARLLKKLGRTSEALLVRIVLQRKRYKDFRSALQDCERLIVARPRSAQERRMRVVVCRDQRDYDRPLSAIDEAIEFDPQDPYGFLVRARFLFWLGRIYETRTLLEKAAEISPTSFEPHHDLASYAIHTGEPCDPVRESLDTAGEPTELYVAAMASRKLDRKDPARSFLERAIARTEATFPRNPELAALRAEASELILE